MVLYKEHQESLLKIFVCVYTEIFISATAIRPSYRDSTAHKYSISFNMPLCYKPQRVSCHCMYEPYSSSLPSPDEDNRTGKNDDRNVKDGGGFDILQSVGCFCDCLSIKAGM